SQYGYRNYWPDILIPQHDEYGYNTGVRCAFYALSAPPGSNLPAEDSSVTSLSACNTTCSSACASDYIPPNQSRVFFVDVFIPRATDLNLPVGIYNGALGVHYTINGAAQDLITPVDIMLRNFELPSTSTLPNFYGVDAAEIAAAEKLPWNGDLASWGGPDQSNSVGFHTFRYARALLDHRLTPAFV